ncbi:MAG: Ig-like domain-containing protein [Nitrospinota bacterium]|nr:Ig-like domain-containing protein [Nitrospinota bacterium]
MLKPKTTHLGFFTKVLLLLVLCFPLKALGQTADPFPPPEIMDENCVATANNIAVTVNPNGTFSLSGPLPLGQYRVRVVCERDGVVTQGQSGFLEGIFQQVTEVGPIFFGAQDLIPESLELSSSLSELNQTLNTTQIQVTGIIAGGIQVDMTAGADGTSYVSTNPAIATVSPDGMVTAVASGSVLISVRNEGAVSTLPIQVVLSDDTDGDGLPDDYEVANALNPGGTNAARLTGTIASAHTELSGSEAAKAVDGDPNTVWTAGGGGSPTFFEVYLPQDTPVAQVRLVGNPSHAGGAVEFFRGVFQAFDALDTEIYNSGEISLSGSDPEVAVAINAPGARRIRFTSTGAESLQPSLAEFQVISGPGGAGSGLDLNFFSDAAMDFDLDGLTNLEEFILGTSIFNPDTDGDGLTDSEEGALGSNPLLADGDGDGLTDLEEQNLGTNFNLADTDGDGLLDGVEVAILLNPLSTDSDLDGDLDGNEDTDGDGITNINEVLENTDPGNPDTDGDGLSDLEELTPGADGYITNPRKRDTDGDRLPDNYEIAFGRDPTVPEAIGPDADQDGLPDTFESANTAGGEGSNLAALTDSVAEASSVLADFPKENAIDGDLATSWFTDTGDAANQGSVPFIQVTLPFTSKVSLIKLLGNRINPDNHDFTQGVLQGFDENDNVIFDSGLVTLPLPDRDLILPVSLDGLRKMKFTSVVDEGLNPGLSEVQVFADLSGTGLNLNLFADAELDFDGDGFSNLIEFYYGTNIFLADSDADGLSDFTEFNFKSNPNSSDTDGDGLADRRETDPTLDFDGDGTANILDADADNDGLPDGVEVSLGLSHLNTDTDGDGISDGQEDTDGDGLVNSDELAANTDPGNADTDGDGILDGEELVAGADGYITDPLLADTDGDGMVDGFETQYGLNPLDSADAALDSDGDGISNLDEFLAGTDPTNPDIVPPAVFEIDPLDGATDVAVTNMITARFTEPLQPESVVAGVIQLMETDTQAEVPGSVGLSGDQLTVTFNPIADLQDITGYTVKVQGVRDVAGNLMVGVFQSSFTTSGVVDTVQPWVVRSNYVQNGFMPINSPVTVEFSEPIDPASLTTTSFQVFDDNYNSITGEYTFDPLPGTIQVDPGGTRASFIADPLLPRAHWMMISLSAEVTDRAGNPLLPYEEWIRTDNEEDTTSPALISHFPENTMSGLPLNSVVWLFFSETLSQENDFLSEVKITTGGVEVSGSFSMEYGNREVMFVSESPFLPGADYTVTVGPNIRDMAGNTLGTPTGFSFQTGVSIAANQASVAYYEPAPGTTVPTNAKFMARFSEPVIRGTVELRGNFGLYDPQWFSFEWFDSPGTEPIGTVTLSADRRTATFIPNQLTPYDKGNWYATLGIKDYAGRRILNYFSSPFQVGPGPSATGPVVQATSLVDGTVDVPVNAQVVIQFDVPVSLTDEGSYFVRLVDGANIIDGSITFDTTRSRLTFTPSVLLTPGTSYTVEIGGFTDLAGNPILATYTSGFTSSASSLADTAGPVLTSISPAHGATNVSVNSNIVMTFDENIDPLSVSSQTINIQTSTVGVLGGQFSVNGNIVTFTPLVPLPAGASISISRIGSGIRDYAGNIAFYSSSFQTEAISDVDRPQVSLMNPSPGSVDVHESTQVMLVFSEYMDRNTLVKDNFALYINGERSTNFNVLRSPDNNAVVISSSLPSSASVTVVATNRVHDTAGNPLVDFQGQFTTRALTSTSSQSGPNLITFRPGWGATGVPVDAQVRYLFDAPLDPLSLTDGWFFAEDNLTKSGSKTLDLGGKMAVFTPDTPFGKGKIVEGFMTEQLRGINGIPVEDNIWYQVYPWSAFLTEQDPAALTPQVVDFIPYSGAVDVPVNAVIEARFNEPLNPATANSTNVILKDSVGATVPSSVSLAPGNKIIRLVPNALLAAGANYTFEISTGVTDPDENPLNALFSQTFTTGASEDNVMPEVVAVSPPNGAAGIPITALIRFRFDEPVNPLTISEQTVTITDGLNNLVHCTLQFANNDRDIVITPQSFPAPFSTYTITVNGVEDQAGNAVIPFTSQFYTGEGLDFITSRTIQRTPSDGSTDVPVNAVVRVESPDPLDFWSVTGPYAFTLIPRSSGQTILGFASLSPDGKVATFVPDNPLPAGDIIDAYVWIANLSFNYLIPPEGEGTWFAFSTSNLTDTTPPNLLGIIPTNGDVGMPINPLIRVKFDEPVYVNSYTGISLEKLDGTPVATKFALVEGSAAATLRPVEFLQAHTQYRIRVDSSVADSAGNANPFLTESFFTTGSHVDIHNPNIVSLEPPTGSVEVSTNATIIVQFDEPVNPLFNQDGVIQLNLIPPCPPDDPFLCWFESPDPIPVSGAISFAPDRLSATFTPDQPLQDSSDYEATISGVMDFAGNQLVGSGFIFFSTGSSGGGGILLP